jgi:hypothetical protein
MHDLRHIVIVGFNEFNGVLPGVSLKMSSQYPSVVLAYVNYPELKGVHVSYGGKCSQCGVKHGIWEAFQAKAKPEHVGDFSQPYLTYCGNHLPQYVLEKALSA